MASHLAAPGRALSASQAAQRRRHGFASVAASSRPCAVRCRAQATERRDALAECTPSTSCPERPSLAAGGALLAAAAVATTSGLLWPEAASALTIHTEPANALSLQTWAIHVSSVLEWVTAMGLMWRYAEVTGNPRWKGMAWGMVPALGSAMAACTWHWFYNSPDLEFLVVLQSALTVVGNCTCWWAAYRIYAAGVAEKSSA
ncbi:hypothetical protein HYH03_013863 [Edaphochlamys debaryana]|uniref:Ycf49-like protein n=1 Tax=Edaphochlamys debaryana TaxID=47281 RepID=A0A836BU64_9CHLO|nr:hypothetical protein HYH03_013863 [Edaphochlamys debaryana]|eukprot:KAG2487584.1 hypothetical protein HYH03_013863 [Edaphochlamys debaryana]